MNKSTKKEIIYMFYILVELAVIAGVLVAIYYVSIATVYAIDNMGGSSPPTGIGNVPIVTPQIYATLLVISLVIVMLIFLILQYFSLIPLQSHSQRIKMPRRKKIAVRCAECGKEIEVSLTAPHHEILDHLLICAYPKGNPKNPPRKK